MAECIILVGPPGSGKSTLAATYADYVYINQDSQGPAHLDLFVEAIATNKDVIVDRMGFSKEQRSRYLNIAIGHNTKIIVIHEPYDTCLARMLERRDHPTIKDEHSAKKALKFFFRNYERVEDSEAHIVERKWPIGDKPQCIYSDLDGTLCEISHRLHHVRGEGRKNWPAFFDGLSEDTVNEPVMTILELMSIVYPVVYCSGRPDSHKIQTQEWLDKYQAPKGLLFMRPSSDNRKDNIVKEILLDFEILTRYEVFFCLDDRDQVVQMLRSRGLTVLQVANGNF